VLSRISAAVAIGGAIVALASAAQAAGSGTLIDQQGRGFTLASLHGTPLVVTFVAAHCTDACPLINAQFARAASDFREGHIRAKLVTITLDPEHDPPATMKALARKFGADPRVWIVAGGNLANVHNVMREFGVAAQRGRKGYADVHTTFVYFVDARGNLRKTIFASSDLNRQIMTQLSSLPS